MANQVILSYNTKSGKYSLCGQKDFLCDIYLYNITTSLWVKENTTDPLDTTQLTKPTAKALKLLADTIELYYND